MIKSFKLYIFHQILLDIQHSEITLTIVEVYFSFYVFLYACKYMINLSAIVRYCGSRQSTDKLTVM